MSQDEKRFVELRAQLTKLGYIRRGTLLHRFTRCGRSGCHCHADPPQMHGPYYEWTRKVKGKTVNVRLTEAQAELMKAWIANARRLEEIVGELEDISGRVTEPLLLAAAAKQPRPPR
jgi:hypothetical protein